MPAQSVHRLQQVKFNTFKWNGNVHGHEHKKSALVFIHLTFANISLSKIRRNLDIWEQNGHNWQFLSIEKCSLDHNFGIFLT